MKSHPPATVVMTLLVIAMAATVHAEPRAWTNAQGKQVQAEFGGLKDGQVTLIMAGGRTAAVPLKSLSATDQEWVRQNAPKAVAPPPVSATTVPDPADAGRLPWDKRRMPKEVREPTLSMNIKVVKETPTECIYESGHFQFKTSAKLGQALMKDVCRAFESTYELVRQMPWGIVPRPEEGHTKFQAELYATREQYLATGAPSWSAGVYMRKDKVFRMPFSELGISDTPGPAGYYRKGAINNDTITHEITHQMMHEYLVYMPIWLVEGLAEYTSNMEYKSGVFTVAEDNAAFVVKKSGSRFRGLFNAMRYQPRWIGAKSLWTFTTDISQANPIVDLTMAAKKKREQPPAPAEPPPQEPSTPTQLPPNSVPAKGQPGVPPSMQFVPVVVPPQPPTMEELAARYRSAHVLTYFFMHEDGGKRLLQFFDAVHEEKRKWPVFWERVRAYNAELKRAKPAYDTYRIEMGAFMRTPGVKDLGDGRFSYPSNLTPPVAPVMPEPPQPPDDTDPDAVCAKHLDILLGGRSLQKLEEDVRVLFQENGMPL